MPSLGDIMDAVDLLQVKAVEIDRDMCVRSANRNSKCEKCAKSCIADAIHLGRGEIEIDNGVCVNCGCCVPVCPVGALSMVDPTANAVLNRALSVSDPESRFSAIACSRIASKNLGDPDKYAQVPCLGHISEVQLMELASAGIDDIVLIDGVCDTCKYGAASKRIDSVIETASRFLDACDCEAIITRQSDFPKEMLSSSMNSRGEGRRGLLRQTTSYVKTVASNVAKKTIEDKLQGPDNKNKSLLSERLKRGRGAGIYHFEPTSNYKIIEAMEKLLEDEGENPEDAAGANEDVSREISTRHFGNVYVDIDRCSGCGMCVLFCPTQALKYDEYDQPENEDARFCDFQASDCTQCMLCKDVCLRECLEVSPKVELKELFDFEPRLIEIAKPKKTTSLLGIAKRNL